MIHSLIPAWCIDPKVAVDRNPFEPQAADKGSHIPQVADEENLLHLAKDASAAVTQMDPTTAPPTAVNGGKSRGIKLSKAQVCFLSIQGDLQSWFLRPCKPHDTSGENADPMSLAAMPVLGALIMTFYTSWRFAKGDTFACTFALILDAGESSDLKMHPLCKLNQLG